MIGGNHEHALLLPDVRTVVHAGRGLSEVRLQARDGAKEGGMSDRIGQKLARERKKQDAARAFPKGPTRKAIKAKKDRAEAKQIRRIRERCVERDGVCRCTAYQTDRKQGTWVICEGLSEWAHFGDRKRAQTRNMPPTYRHSTAASLMLCTRHHKLYDAGLLKIRAFTDAGCDGPLEFTC